MNINETIGAYLEELSSSAPTPGGGNVAALCGVLASSLGIMACNLTIGRKKYTEIEKEIIEIKDKIEGYKNIFVILGKDDNEAFEQVMLAYKLPKETEEQKNTRMKAIDKATFEAAVVPAKVITVCSEILPLLKVLSEKGNQNSLSDIGVAISLINTAAEGAMMNVLINYSGLSDRTPALSLKDEAERSSSSIREQCNIQLKAIRSKFST